MGGHAHGEVASSVAIAAMASLDEDPPGGDLLSAIEAAVRDANRKLHEMVGRDPSLKGMGTTLTAMLWHGTRWPWCHVGDSRAYLLRDGELYQITHDHTLVQSLVDDGRITPEEAATHPQRSILLRALDGSGEVEPDLSLREAQVGDRYLLCSDGLSGVVSAETMHATLTNDRRPGRGRPPAHRPGQPRRRARQHHLRPGRRAGARRRAAGAAAEVGDGRCRRA